MWFMINDMVVPGSSYWNVALAREAGDVSMTTRPWPPSNDSPTTWPGCGTSA